MNKSDKKRKTRVGRMDFISKLISFDDKTGEIEVELQPDPRRYDKIEVKGKVAYKDKFTSDVISLSGITLAPGTERPIFYAPPKSRDPCSYLTERKELKEHWDDKYILHDAKAPLLKALQQLRGKETQIVILYVDMSGSTKISAHLDPEINKKIVRIFVMQMAQVVDTYNGFVYKFIGDCVVGVFPADVNFTGMSDNAIQAAMMMRNVVEDVINPVFDEKGLPRIGLHIGLDMGPVLVDTFGANKIAAFDELVGLTMNVASKIAERAKDNQILLGRSLFEVLHVSWQEFCREITFDQEWTITDPVRGGKYKVYKFNGMWNC